MGASIAIDCGRMQSIAIDRGRAGRTVFRRREVEIGVAEGGGGRYSGGKRDFMRGVAGLRSVGE